MASTITPLYCQQLVEELTLAEMCSLKRLNNAYQGPNPPQNPHAWCQGKDRPWELNDCDGELVEQHACIGTQAPCTHPLIAAQQWNGRSLAMGSH
eukprot:scaffold132205_cov33-Tisochrysis_lutea.AAC.1